MNNPLLEGSTVSQYRDWPAVLAALERIGLAHADGRLRSAGRWTPAENLDHLGVFMRASLEGFSPNRLPLPLRLIGRLMKPLALSDRPTPKGIKLKGPVAEALLPTPDKDFASALAEVRSQIGRVHPGPGRNPYIPASPLFGPLTEAEWTKIHLKHFRHHLGYLRIGEGNADGEAPAR